MKKLLLILSFSLLLGCASKETQPTENETSLTLKPTETEESTIVDESILTFGSTFQFDNFEINVGDEPYFTTLSNIFSSHDGKKVVVFPLQITNIGDTTSSINIFYTNYFGPSGTEIENLNLYYDDGLGFSGDLRKGATQDINAYLLYSEDGDYVIEFAKLFDTPIELILPVYQ